MPGEPFLTFWKQWDVVFILVFEVFSHFEVGGAVYVHNPGSKRAGREEEAAGWQNM